MMVAKSTYHLFLFFTIFHRFFFKYALGSEDEDSAYIRNTIIERVTGIHPKESIVLNPNLDPTLLVQKQSILDIHVKDEQGHEYDFEWKQ